MRNTKGLKSILIILGLLLIALGAWRLFAPISFFDANGMVLLVDPSLLSEARGIGGVVTISGFFILLGAFIPKLSFTSTVLAMVVFISFGTARLLGIVLDGAPNDMVIQGMISEFVFGSLAVFAYFKFRER